MREALSRLLDGSAAVRNQYHSEPAENSKADLERAAGVPFMGGEVWGDPLEQAFNHGVLLLVSAEDFSKSICDLLQRDMVPVFSHVVLMRSALEHASRSRHLLDPKVGARTRASRMMNERLYSFYEQVRLPTTTDELDRTRSRIAALLEEAERLNFKIVRHKSGDRWIDEARESPTRLVRKLFTDGSDHLGAVLYSYSSAVAHGTWFGLRQSIGPAPRGGNFAEKDRALFTSTQGVVGTLTTLILGLGAAYDSRDDLLGWLSPTWTELRQQTLRVARSHYSRN
jgi:hypothetical protein